MLTSTQCQELIKSESSRVSILQVDRHCNSREDSFRVCEDWILMTVSVIEKEVSQRGSDMGVSTFCLCLSAFPCFLLFLLGMELFRSKSELT
jgi:hypothetical protein